ncbi:Maf family protein [Corynebacterium otitidis]|uniref:Nucleoside triphosphate pyrophosphatase n=1 Tax=Corynebacterium otitidis ATCC 51513 TaxID=883169 RepID=I7KJL7_9CORY|nr:Maf family nucleotide pyrophosphatase [Corynebacterium otitidis]EJZ81917.1 septum formation protein Maf [Corynebacterium otitidis ATCC 51513]KKO84365.1 septum formation inhibitor Maf [Corynebacterium otitidis]CCI83690.1 nucleotide binding protein [Corynebacterium otitidis ATCC 51513]
MRLILASRSPSRLGILKAAGVDPEVRPADVDERAIEAGLAGAAPGEVVEALARAKARAVAESLGAAAEGAVVVGGDSMLLLDGKLLGKPHTEEETVRRWREQAGRRATLLTGQHVSYLPAGATRPLEASTHAATDVHFASPSEADIAAYAASGEPLECAGAFTLEALGGWFIDRIEGDPSAVIGLSLPALRASLYELGVDASALWRPGTAG